MKLPYVPGSPIEIHHVLNPCVGVENIPTFIIADVAHVG
jgi:hypothetical protein